MNCSIFDGVPNEAKKLIWEVFFASRQRGVELKIHFPWIDQTNDINCFALTKPCDSQILATLILKKQFIGSRLSYAMVGMVCVDDEWRGHGLGKKLMNYMLDYSTEKRIPALVLWTTQPKFYSRYGFISDNSDFSGKVTLNPLQLNAKVKYEIKTGQLSRGLPPFAKRIIQFANKTSSLFVIESIHGLMLVEWEGTTSAAVDLVESAMPLTWDLSTSVGNSIIHELSSRGHYCMACKSADRMIRYLNTPTQIPYISTLNRI